MKQKFNSKELTEEGEKYESYAEIMDNLIDDGYSEKDSITAINFVAELNSMDLGDEAYLFLAGVEYGRKKVKK